MEISNMKISFVDREMFPKNRKLLTKIYRKNIDQQTFFHANSQHSKSLQESYPFGGAFQIKHISSTVKDFIHQCQELKEGFIKQGRDAKLFDKYLNTLQHKAEYSF